MNKFTYTIKDKDGIHARPAGMLVKEASKFDSQITIEAKGNTANAKKIFSVMSLGVKYDDEITVTVEGNDEPLAMEAMEKFIKENL